MKLYLVRHGHAGQRLNGDFHDRYRRLSGRGQQEADRIARALGDIEVGAVISSPSTRCVQTVEPLAAKLGLEIIEDDRLWEDADIPDAITLLNDHTDRGAVLCSHGNIIPEILHWLIEDGMRTKGRGCAKGSVWTLTHDGTGFTKARYRHLDDLPF